MCGGVPPTRQFVIMGPPETQLASEEAMIDEELLAILRCPETMSTLKLMSDEQLQQLNERISRGGVSTLGGDPVRTPLQAGLVTEDGGRVYRIEDEIPIMLIEEAILLKES